jgi:hypothetical protein
MSFHHSLFKALACLIALSLPLVGFSGSAIAEVVFGNLGASGTGALGGTNTDIGEGGDVAGLAQGFSTGAAGFSTLTVQSITLGLFGATSPAPPVSATVGIYANVSGAPAATPLFTSSALNVQETGLYAFIFSGAVLSPNTTYWIQPSSGISWHINTPGSTPTVQNGSTYSYVGTLELPAGPSPAWETAGLLRYATSINAVPEPSTYAMAAIGAGVAGLMGWRRRKMVADAAAAV